MKERKLLCSIEELDKVLCKRNCLVYGAGKVAKTIVKYAYKKECVINKILVSDIYGNPSEILGTPVCEVEKYQEHLRKKTVIVAVMEKTHYELEDKISHYDFGETYFVADELFEKVNYYIGDFETEYLSRLENIEEKIIAHERKMLKLTPRPCMEYMVLNILDHCNLKCKGCDHFACIADPYFVEYEKIHQDLNRLSEIFHGDYITKIGVMGGEPLLHPDLLKILKDVRNHFPHTIIRLTTNGLLLLKQEDVFWRVCREQNVTIVNTKYPINLDYNKMQKKAQSEGVKFQFFEGTGGYQIKKSFKRILNLEGNGNPVENFINCFISNYGNFLMEGKLYGCPFSCQSYRIFNKKFHQNLRMTENDYLDIYKVQDMQEILEFAARPKYYCRYCHGVSPLFDWTRSKQEISEWVEGKSSL